MSLTIGDAPFGNRPGVFNFERQGPRHVLYFEDSPRRVRVMLGGECVADSRRVKLLHETGLLPVYYFPEADVRRELLTSSEHTTHCPFKGDARYHSVEAGGKTAENAVWSYPEPLEGAPPLAGYLAFYWGRMDRWLEEDEEVLVHPRDPYHRVDVVQSSRHVRASIDGQRLADSERPVMLFETGLPPRFYLPKDDVETEVLIGSHTRTQCPYKGEAAYHHVQLGQRYEDVVWYYSEPLAAAAKIRDLLCFYNERIDLEVDGEPWERPKTRFSP